MKLSKNQQGLGSALVIALIVLVLGVAGAAYYFVSKNSDKKDGGSTNNSAIQAECTKSIDDKDFCKFVSSWSFGKEQKITMTSPEDESVTVIEYDSNGNSRMTSSQGGTEQYAAITIGNTSYMKNVEENNWVKYTSETPDTTDTETDFSSEFDIESEVEKDTSKITAQGKEACGNLTCFKYSVTDSNAPGEETIFWFDDKDYLLRRMRTVSSNGTAEWTVEYEVSDITEPSPVVEMPDFEGMSAEEMQQYLQQLPQ